MNATTLALKSRPLTPEEVYRRHRDFLEEIEPRRKIQTRLLLDQPVRLTLTIPGNISTHEILWNPVAKETCDKISEVIALIAERYKV
jgi:hypothetical protein